MTVLFQQLIHIGSGWSWCINGWGTFSTLVLLDLTDFIVLFLLQPYIIIISSSIFFIIVIVLIISNIIITDYAMAWLYFT